MYILLIQENYKIEDLSTNIKKKNSSFFVKDYKDSSRISNFSNLSHFSQSKKTDLLQHCKLTTVMRMSFEIMFIKRFYRIIISMDMKKLG